MAYASSGAQRGGSSKGTRAIEGVLVLIGLVLAATGAYLRTIVTETEGTAAFHGWGSLGLALLGLGLVLVVLHWSSGARRAI